MHKKILYIEDDEQNKILVRKLLNSRGHEVLEADNGLEGIEKAKEFVPDLILIDINMPGLDGFETTTRLKGIDETKDIPIVALTARRTEEDRERSLVAGCSGFISKPIDIDTFVGTVEDYLSGVSETVPRELEGKLLRNYCQYLVKSLETKVKRLEGINEELEKRVDERTRELREMQSKVLEMEKKKTLLELAGGAAHELNQPLTVLMSLSELLISHSDKENSEEYNLLVKLRDECFRIADIVKKMASITDYKTKKYYKDINILDLD